jgi:hypothetical protein
MGSRSRLVKCLTLLAGALALVLGGCGGGGSGGRLSKKQYETKLRNVGTQVSTDLGRLGVVIQNPSVAQLDQTQTELNQAARQLDAAKPPKDAATDNQKLAASIHFLASSLDQLKTPPQKKSAATLQAFAQSVAGAPQIQQGRAATGDLRKKGYNVGPTLGG